MALGGDLSKQKDAVRLADIQALQLLSERCTSSGNGSRRSYYSYELNLILNDGKRINVMDHGNKAALVEDAKVISIFLDVPVWDR
ncbi:hypothetical protein [Alkalimarinus coralli]|uniref:hypothetical protein n=1 Tax=Alkalimarinus coralli TaxID=2935863 RepID=UPI00202B9088|nr:hypothetical protein [Alkalimarinus coralli]